jgi:antitoxin ParD1/3/4
MKDWCEDQVRRGRYSTTSDYIRDLIRRDQDSRTGVKALQTLIDEGLASGISPLSDRKSTRLNSSH